MERAGGGKGRELQGRRKGGGGGGLEGRREEETKSLSVISKASKSRDFRIKFVGASD